jgi:hypothetical protein
MCQEARKLKPLSVKHPSEILKTTSVSENYGILNGESAMILLGGLGPYSGHKIIVGIQNILYCACSIMDVASYVTGLPC